MTAGLLWSLLFSDHSYLVYRQEQRQLERLQRQIIELRRQRERLAREILRLRNDPDELERLIHQQLGYIHPDEYIILHPEDPYGR
ncbi:MAG: septum formation initiator family protein [Zetaproteobacteria bacterium]|nr:MAG: septum formation initiator family protein [Zetaproteobacteria bacterium]